ncbi:MAG: adenylate/guanylate cyclase domain-containing protein [Simkaniaceae bacterium]|nr:adenylate/guanylate cyclase domain-containing protein [Candidatus Sacchlamyda saccharinae]
MKYRTKLYIALVAIASASIILGLVIFSVETEKLIFRMLQSRSLSVATTAAVQLNPELVEQANLSKTGTPEHDALRLMLQKTVSANRRNDIYVSDIYTLYPDPKNSKGMLFGVDASVDPESPGTPYKDSDLSGIFENRHFPYVDKHFVADQWGLWLSAYAPIKDKDGNYISTLGVDINAKDIHVRSEQLLKYAIWGLLASLVLSIVIAYFLSKKVTLSLDHICSVVKEIGEGNLNAESTIETNDEFGVLSHSINDMSKGLRERERLKMSFARYVSTHVMEKILHSETPLNLEGERRKVTILFSDIRQFTQLAENLPPEEVVHLLNEYFEVMIEAIFSHSGTLDKFIGDGIMAEFGAPLDDQQQEEHAIRAAIAMQKELEKLSAKWEGENKPRIQMGIGIHTGDAVLGNIGSEKRIEYTAIGDAVNVASRLEQATKVLKAPILISETTYLGAKDKFNFKDLGSMALPGRKEQIKVYTINLGSY